MRWKSIIWTISGLLVLLGLTWLIKFLWLSPVNIEDFFERIAYEQAELDSESYIQLPQSTRDQFSPFRIKYHERSPNFYEKRANLSRKQLHDLKGYPTKYLTEGEHISYTSISHLLGYQTSAAMFAQQHHLISSLQPTSDPIFFLLYQQPVRNVDEAKAYTNRMRQISQVYDQIITGLKACEDQALYPPQLLVETKINQLKQILSISPAEHPLYLQYADKIVKVSHMEINQYEKIDYLKSAEKRIQEDVFPACKRMIEYLETLLPKTNDSYSQEFSGESQAFYKHLLAGYLGQGFSPDSLHQEGLEAVEKYLEKRQTYIDSLEKAISGTQELIERIQSLAYQISEGSPDSLLNYSHIRKHLEKFKNTLEESGFKWTGVLGTSIPSNLEVNVLSPIYNQEPMYYQQSGFETNGKAILYLNASRLAFIDQREVFTYAVPGKHFQMYQQIQDEDLSLFSRLIQGTALQNGWMLYTLKLANEYGFLTESSTNALKESLLLYAVLLTVDTGFFSQGWSLEQANEYLQEKLNVDEIAAERWLTQILSYPGKYSSYWTGYQHILSLREEAKNNLGLNFNIADFHQWILKHQTIPLDDISSFYESYSQNVLD